MSIFKCFKRTMFSEGILPKADGPLAMQIPSSTISAVIKEVKAVLSPSAAAKQSKHGK